MRLSKAANRISAQKSGLWWQSICQKEQRAAALILLVAVGLGMLGGWGRAWLQGRPFVMPPLVRTSLLVVAFIPQLLAFYLPATSQLMTDRVVALLLVSSQALLLLFGWANRTLRPVWLLLLGLGCNFLVIVSNGGLMPMSPATLAQLLPADRVAAYAIGERLGHTKDRLLPAAATNFALLADRMVLPSWTGLKVAYSLGDVLIAAGAFWLLWAAGGGTMTDDAPSQTPM